MNQEKLSSSLPNRTSILQKICIPFPSPVTYVAFCYLEQQPDKVVLLTRKGEGCDMQVFTQDQALEAFVKFDTDVASQKYYLPPEVFELTFPEKGVLVNSVRDMIREDSSCNRFAKDRLFQMVDSLDDSLQTST
ncbi:MAG TPA: hypothetical protein VGT05_01730 [Patescibacteria group bacterium]|nr:hypothetical protein [Patescibacteria group bacterium]